MFMSCTIKVLISNCRRTRKFSRLLQAVAFDFSHHGHALVTLLVYFYALIGQNLTGEFMRKMYAASGTCFLIAEADRVLCRQLVMF